MTTIISITEILNLLREVKNYRKDYLTNFYIETEKFELLINHRLIEFVKLGETVFFCKRNLKFKNLYFCTTGIDALREDLAHFMKLHPGETFLADLIGKLKDVTVLENVFRCHDFYRYASLVRMSQTNHMAGNGIISNENISFADRLKAKEVNDLLNKYFDPYAEQLPLKEELYKLSDHNRVIVYSEDNEIKGFIIFELSGKTSYLRYWFVHPEYREKKIGSRLLRRYFDESISAKRKLFWVIESNSNAIKRYEHYGFEREDLLDHILINKDIKYEG